MRIIRVVRVLVLAAVVMIATAIPASAGGFSTSWSGFACVHPNGGAYGFGYIKSKARIEENGSTRANYFKIIGRWQQQSVDGGAWFSAYPNAVKTLVSSSFPANPTQYFYNPNFQFGFRFEGDYIDYWNRIQFTAEAWDSRPGGDVLLYSRTFHTFNRDC
jgi:hypothetical protein